MNWLFKLIIWVLTVLLLTLVVILALSHLNYPNAYKVLLVQSGSMSPTIYTGDLIFIQKKSIYYSGDIVTFLNQNNQKVTHRIVKIQNDKNIPKYFTKGDANNSEDTETITFQQVLGKVVYVIPKLGYLVSFSKTAPGLIVLVIIPSTIIVYDEIKKIKLHLSGKRR